MTTLRYLRLSCDGEDCYQDLVIYDPRSARQLKLTAARHGWLVKRGEWCPACRAQVEVTGSNVAQ